MSNTMYPNVSLIQERKGDHDSLLSCVHGGAIFITPSFLNLSMCCKVMA